MRLDRSEIRFQAAWAIPALILLAVCVIGYCLASWQAGTWLRGGSAAGLLCGLIAGLIILFEMLLWPRKTWRRLRLGPTKHWMAAHIWFGLACLPLAFFHCGFHLGGTLPTVLIILLAATVASGVFGLVMQNVLPSWMLRNLPAETIYSQIDYVSQQAVEDSRRMLIAACGAPLQAGAKESQDPTAGSDEAASLPSAVVVGAVRDLGRSRGRTLRTTTVTAHRDDRAILWSAFAEIEPFLLQGSAMHRTLSDPLRAGKYFDLLRRTCHDESAAIVEILQQQCDQRRQFDAQQRVHRWLHAWIPVHLGLSVALSILLAVHIWTALKYW